MATSISRTARSTRDRSTRCSGGYCSSTSSKGSDLVSASGAPISLALITSLASAPREGGVAGGVQPSGLVAGEAERFEQPLLLAQQLPGYQRPDPDHLVSVVGVGDDVGILPEHVEDGETVRGEAPDPTRGLLGEEVTLALEALVAVREGRGPHPGEVFSDHEVRALGSVRIDGYLVGGLVNDVGCGAALYPVEVEVRLVVDPPELVGDELAVLIVERGVGVDVDYRRHVAVVVHEEARLDPEHALLQRPVRPHVAVVGELAVGTLDRDLSRQIQHLPDVPDPRPDAHHEVLATDRAPIGLHGAHSAAVEA